MIVYSRRSRKCPCLYLSIYSKNPLSDYAIKHWNDIYALPQYQHILAITRTRVTTLRRQGLWYSFLGYIVNIVYRHSGIGHKQNEYWRDDRISPPLLLMWCVKYTMCGAFFVLPRPQPALISRSAQYTRMRKDILPTSHFKSRQSCLRLKNSRQPTVSMATYLIRHIKLCSGNSSKWDMRMISPGILKAFNINLDGST